VSLADVISRFSTAAADGVPNGYVLTRTTAAPYASNGVAGSSSTTTLNIDACVQPNAGKSIHPLPEGINVDDVVAFDTVTALQLLPVPDAITYRGDTYTLYRIDGPRTLGGVSTFTGYFARTVLP
jgi:hypothetical protein